MSKTPIEWATHTLNPVAGCAIVSEGCKYCYAMQEAFRLEQMRVAKYKGLTRLSGGRRKWNGKINLDYNALKAPLKWKKPRDIFVNSMSDFFHEDVPVEFIRKFWDVMEQTPQHTYMILTKRPEIMKSVLVGLRFPVLHNVWLGVSVENAAQVGRIDILRDIPCGNRFVSFEPLIGSIMPEEEHVGVWDFHKENDNAPNLTGIDWAIVGGESGKHARPIQEAWIDEIFTLCERYYVAFFFKQWGSHGADGIKRDKKLNGRLYRGEYWDTRPPKREPDKLTWTDEQVLEFVNGLWDELPAGGYELFRETHLSDFAVPTSQWFRVANIHEAKMKEQANVL